jgi:fermentation-respiration switch protein FrsA (DUF1100 family)
MLEDRTLFPDLISPTFEHPKFKFAALVAGFNPKLQDATVNTLLASSGVVKTPSLHIVGELDTLVLPEAMLDLADKFEKPKVFKHAGG